MATPSWKYTGSGRLFILVGCIISLRNSILILNKYSNRINRLLVHDDVPKFRDLSIPQHQSRTQPITKNLTGANATETSACLLIMDDNHYLIEWIAYHYHVVNLRHLIIAIDPRSQTSPIEIVRRWRYHMNIAVWLNYDEYNIPNQTAMIHNAEERVRMVLKNAKEPYNYELIQHRARQRLFYSKCMIEHQKQSSSSSSSSHRSAWTLFLDTDEYVSINYPTIATLRPFYHLNNITIPSISEPGSVLKLIEMERKYFNSSKNGQERSNNITSSPCIQIPRFRYGTMELPTINKQQTLNVPSMINISQFATIRWQIHANSNNYGMNRISKTMIDVSRVSYDDLYNNFPIVESIHKPLPIHNFCTRRKLHIRSTQQIFIIHHYLGTYEQYIFRNDSRRSNERSDKMYHMVAKLNQTVSSIQLAPWLEGFIQVHGIEQVMTFLHDVGVV